MQLGKFTDFGLRVLIHLAIIAPRRGSASAIAAAFDVSEHHVAKVCTRLVQEGFLTSERGRNGGLSLARAPSDIRLGKVVRSLSYDAALVECFAPNAPDCRIAPACAVRIPLAEAREAFYDALDRYSLADVTRNQTALRALLSLD